MEFCEGFSCVRFSLINLLTHSTIRLVGLRNYKLGLL